MVTKCVNFGEDSRKNRGEMGGDREERKYLRIKGTKE